MLWHPYCEWQTNQYFIYIPSHLSKIILESLKLLTFLYDHFDEIDGNWWKKYKQKSAKILKMRGLFQLLFFALLEMI